MIYIKKVNKKKFIKALFGTFSIPIVFTLLLDILVIKEIINVKWLHVFGIDQESGIYYFLNEVIDFGDFQDQFYVIICILCLMIIIIICYFFICSIKQERLLIIEHNSLNQTRFKFDENIKEKYNIKILKFNEYDTFHSDKPLKEMVLDVIIEVESKTSEIKKYIMKDYSIGYAGIANIPATFMLGYELGDENRRKLFHKFHGKNTKIDLKDDNFHLLESKTIRSSFNKDILRKSNDTSKDANIVLIISLTQPINLIDLTSVIGENDFVFKYTSSDQIDYDVIDSESQIEDFTNLILSDISELQKKENIKQIKICVAASSAFIFGLGSKFSKTQNKSTVIYHFDKNNYPWGINVTNRTPVINI